MFRSTTIEDQQEIRSESSNDDQVTSQTNNSIPAVIVGLYGDRSYSPNPITIENGQTITWYNGDTISHTVTSGQDNDEDTGKEFDSEAIIPNQYYSITFDDSGEVLVLLLLSSFDDWRSDSRIILIFKFMSYTNFIIKI